jgi:hypothetical protein
MKTLNIAIFFLAIVFSVPAFAKDITTFRNPRYEGHFLDWCLTWATDCGRPAARAFCRLKGFDGVHDFQKSYQARGITKTINGNELCRTNVNHPHCDGFEFIKCYVD